MGLHLQRFNCKILKLSLIEASAMKNFIQLISILLLCGVLFNSALAQKNRIDSLQTLLKKDKEDTSKVNHLNYLGWELMNSSPDTAMIIIRQSLSLSEKLQWKKGMASSLGMLGVYYYHKANYPEALEYYLKALRVAEELGDKNLIARHLCNIGNVYYGQGDYPKTLDYYFKALKMTEELGNKQYQANNIGNIGSVYMSQKDYPKALEYNLKALKLHEELGTINDLAIDLGNIGIIYGFLSDHTKALDYQLRSLKMMEELGDKYGIARSMGNIGKLYTLTGKFKEAEVYLTKAIALDDSIGAMDDLRQFEESLSQLYDTTSRYKLALEYYKKAMALEDTLFNQEKNDEITRKEMNYEFDKKEVATKAENEKQLAVADVEIKKQKLQKNFFIAGIVLLLLLSFFVYTNFKTVNELKLQKIRNRIASDLHDDVGSTLNSISVYSEVAKQKSPAVVAELEQIGDASRKIIEVMSDIVWTINPNNDTFENIISRMSTLAYNLLKAKNIEHTFQADESLNEIKLSLEARRNFYLIFKEALNNLVKYSNASRASILLTSENGLIKLSVRDNGVGFDVAQTSKGNGLLNMKARAEEMNAQIKIESEKGSGTNIELILKS